jgi:hypothetical protein
MENKLNIQNINVIPHPLGHFQIHVKFDKIEDVDIDEGVRTHLPIISKSGIKIQCHRNGFYFCVKNREMKEVGDIIYSLTNDGMTFMDRVREFIKMDLKKLKELE